MQKLQTIIETLGLDPKDYEQWSKKPEKFKVHQAKRLIRYACFAMQRELVEGKPRPDNIPQTLVDYFEAQPHFSGWELFADRWDVEAENPLNTYPRKYSIHEEWDAELRMAIPEIPGAKSYKSTDS